MPRRILVVSTVEHGDDELREHVGEADEIKVVVPVVRQECWTGSPTMKKPLGVPNKWRSARLSGFLARRWKPLQGNQMSGCRFGMLSQPFRRTRSSLRCDLLIRRVRSNQSRQTLRRSERWKACRFASS
jgi:hypothetical protein